MLQRGNGQRPHPPFRRVSNWLGGIGRWDSEATFWQPRRAMLLSQAARYTEVVP